MTDNEMIAVLERYGTKNPYAIGHHSGEFDIIADRFRELVEENRAQKAEIERYKCVIKRLENDVQIAGTEAVKEFGKFLIDKDRNIDKSDICDYVVEFFEKKNTSSVS